MDIKPVGDALSIAAVLGSLADVLPPLAALFTLVWTFMRIVDEWPRFKNRIKEMFQKNRKQ